MSKQQHDCSVPFMNEIPFQMLPGSTAVVCNSKHEWGGTRLHIKVPLQGAGILSLAPPRSFATYSLARPKPNLTSNGRYSPPRLLAKQNSNESQTLPERSTIIFWEQTAEQFSVLLWHCGARWHVLKKANTLEQNLKEKENTESLVSVSQEAQSSQRMCSENAVYAQTSKVENLLWIKHRHAAAHNWQNTWNVPKVPVDAEVGVWRNDATLENLLSHHRCKRMFGCGNVRLDQPRIFRTWMKWNMTT